MSVWLTTSLLLAIASADDAPLWVTYEGKEGPGLGKKIVLVSGDEEYRSEEGLPQLAKILAKHHGFTTTVLFAVDRKTGLINPNKIDDIPGLESLRTADLMLLFVRMRNLPDDQMKEIVDYVETGKPIVALRTSTHAFKLDGKSAYAKWDWQSSSWPGGFGRQVLGETWINHHGDHGKESTRGVFAPGQEKHPILTGVKDGGIWGPTDVYGVRLPLPSNSQPLVLGQVLTGMSKDDPPVTGKKNEPMMPVAWTKSYKTESGKTARTFTTTMGASQDLESEDLRRLIVNACYWGLGMEDQIVPDRSVEIVGEYEPSPFRFLGFKRNVKPADHAGLE